ncbi:MAG: D-alanyl-D-alanine carboxypeptidase [Desulfosarcinaceae bacterium]|nr:D-alanyl-D-alanine carboxypeptidase [Desulfosarcinaceae bacterium]
MRFHRNGSPANVRRAGRRYLLSVALISATLLLCISVWSRCEAGSGKIQPQASAAQTPSTVSPPPSSAPCAWPPKLQAELRKHLGPTDAALLAAPDGCHLVAIHAGRPLIPASTLKLLTAAAALHHLGPEYRFQTDFFQDASGNLIIKGYGDPLLISEVVADLAQTLAPSLRRYGDLIIDDEWFKQPLFIPGRRNSLQPYDAPNGALCVNFNTVFFKRRNGKPASAEAQTPLLPFARKKIAASGQAQGRIGLSAGAAENIRYSGELFRYFLEKAGSRGSGTIQSGRVTGGVNRIHRHHSPYPLTEVIQKLMAYSNNFMANQLFITTGIAAYDPPGTLAKAQAAVDRYAREHLGLRHLTLVEGSGISRANRMSALDLLRVLDAFAPHHRLLRNDANEYYKTGTLDGIRTRAGYLMGEDGTLYRFVVLHNTPGRTTDAVLEMFKAHLP